MSLKDKYAGYEDYIETTVELLNSCSTIVDSLQRSSYNPEMLAMTYSIQLLVELVAEFSALALNNHATLRQHDQIINEIIEYLEQ